MKKLFLKRNVIVISITSLLLLLLFVSSQFANASFLGDIFPSVTPTDRLASEIEDVYKALSNPKLDPQIRRSLEQRLKFMNREQTRVAIISQITPHLPPGRGADYTPEPIDEIILTGIIEEPFMLPGQKDVVTENAWQDKVDGEYVTVYAGYRRNTPDDHGVVCYETASTPLVCVDVPEKSGSVHVAERKDKDKAIKLVLKSKKGEDFFFDVRGRKFTKSLDEVVPTITQQAQAPTSVPYTPTVDSPYPAP
jgi:hypothetical protein